MFIRLLASSSLLLAIFAFSGCCSMGPCGSCDTGGCGPCGGGVLPTRLAGRLASNIASPCAQGCGEVYWDERINHPPVCDPCSGGGDCSTGSCGGSCGGCRPLVSRLRDYWGLPYIGACECASPGCDSCGSGVSSGSMISSSYQPVSVSHVAPTTDPGYCPSCAANQAASIRNYSSPSRPQATPTLAQPIESHMVPKAAPQALPSPTSHGPTASINSSRRIRPVSTSQSMVRQ